MSFLFFPPLVDLQTQASFTFSVCQNKVNCWYVSSCCFKLIKHASGTYNLTLSARSSYFQSFILKDNGYKDQAARSSQMADHVVINYWTFGHRNMA